MRTILTLIAVVGLCSMAMAQTPAAEKDVTVQITVDAYSELIFPAGTILAVTAGTGSENSAAVPFTVKSNVGHSIIIDGEEKGALGAWWTAVAPTDHNSWVFARGVDATNQDEVLAFRPMLWPASGPGGNMADTSWWNEPIGNENITRMNSAGTSDFVLTVPASNRKSLDGEIALPGVYEGTLIVTIQH